MKKSFVMTDKEFKEYLSILNYDGEKHLIINGIRITGNKQENINNFFQRLSNKYGFVIDSVEFTNENATKEFLATSIFYDL